MKGILVAGAVATLFSFLFTPALIRFLAKRGYGQTIRDDGPQSHHTKKVTPTIGGVVLILASTTGYFTSQVSVIKFAILLIWPFLLLLLPVPVQDSCGGIHPLQRYLWAMSDHSL